MGGSASRPLRCTHGCWTLKSQNVDDDVYKAKKASKVSRSKIKKIKLSRQESRACQWEEIPTPSVCDRDMPIIEGPPSQEKLIQLENYSCLTSPFHQIKKKIPAGIAVEGRGKSTDDEASFYGSYWSNL
ncbi:hypothetical protein Aduo_002703 [Ancylostoma duodenale]